MLALTTGIPGRLDALKPLRRRASVPFLSPRGANRMPSPSLNRRRLLQATGAAAFATAAGPVIGAARANASVVPPVRSEIGVSAFAFDLGPVQLTTNRRLRKPNPTPTYPPFVGPHPL